MICWAYKICKVCVEWNMIIHLESSEVEVGADAENKTTKVKLSGTLNTNLSSKKLYFFLFY